jgi:hypothetical protein
MTGHYASDTVSYHFANCHFVMAGSRGSRGAPIPAESALFLEECNFQCLLPVAIETPKNDPRSVSDKASRIRRVK